MRGGSLWLYMILGSVLLFRFVWICFISGKFLVFVIFSSRLRFLI